MMIILFSTLIIISLFSNSLQSCSIEDSISSFKKKTLLNPFPLISNNPYLNQTNSSLEQINQILKNKELVCAIKYQDKQNISYIIQTFPNKQLALEKGFIVTHQGQCASCSTLQDLSIFLEKHLTAPARKCGMLTTLSNRSAKKCFKKIGFTDSCIDIWVYNTINTKNNCFFTCIKSWITNEPNVKPDGELNECLQCDEDISGPVFKYYSGRTRRNSGIHSEIDRPSDQIYEMEHCY